MRDVVRFDGRDAEVLGLLDGPGWATVLVAYPADERLPDGLVVLYELHDPAALTEEQAGGGARGLGLADVGLVSTPKRSLWSRLLSRGSSSDGGGMHPSGLGAA